MGGGAHSWADEADSAGVRQRDLDTSAGAGPRKAGVFWVHVPGVCVPLPVPYPYAPSQLPVSVLGPQELPFLIMVENGLLVSAGGPAGVLVTPAQGTSTKGGTGKLCPGGCQGPSCHTEM